MRRPPARPALSSHLQAHRLAKLDDSELLLQRAYRWEKERADKLAAERARAARKKPTNDTLKPVSDKDSGKVSAKIVGNSVEFDGKTYNLSELSKFVDNAAKCYERQFSLSTEAGRAKNKARWDAARPALEKLGYRIEYKGHKVSITGGKVIKA